jgi:hypothetical protein
MMQDEDINLHSRKYIVKAVAAIGEWASAGKVGEKRDLRLLSEQFISAALGGAKGFAAAPGDANKWFEDARKLIEVWNGEFVSGKKGVAAKALEDMARALTSRQASQRRIDRADRSAAQAAFTELHILGLMNESGRILRELHEFTEPDPAEKKPDPSQVLSQALAKLTVLQVAVQAEREDIPAAEAGIRRLMAPGLDRAGRVLAEAIFLTQEEQEKNPADPAGFVRDRILPRLAVFQQDLLNARAVRVRLSLRPAKGASQTRVIYAEPNRTGLGIRVGDILMSQGLNASDWSITTRTSAQTQPQTLGAESLLGAANPSVDLLLRPAGGARLADGESKRQYARRLQQLPDGERRVERVKKAIRDLNQTLEENGLRLTYDLLGAAHSWYVDATNIPIFNGVDLVTLELPRHWKNMPNVFWRSVLERYDRDKPKLGLFGVNNMGNVRAARHRLIHSNLMVMSREPTKIVNISKSASWPMSALGGSGAEVVDIESLWSRLKTDARAEFDSRGMTQVSPEDNPFGRTRLIIIKDPHESLLRLQGLLMEALGPLFDRYQYAEIDRSRFVAFWLIEPMLMVANDLDQVEEALKRLRQGVERYSGEAKTLRALHVGGMYHNHLLEKLFGLETADRLDVHLQWDGRILTHPEDRGYPSFMFDDLKGIAGHIRVRGGEVVMDTDYFDQYLSGILKDHEPYFERLIMQKRIFRGSFIGRTDARIDLHMLLSQWSEYLSQMLPLDRLRAIYFEWIEQPSHAYSASLSLMIQAMLAGVDLMEDEAFKKIKAWMERLEEISPYLFRFQQVIRSSLSGSQPHSWWFDTDNFKPDALPDGGQRTGSNDLQAARLAGEKEGGDGESGSAADERERVTLGMIVNLAVSRVKLFFFVSILLPLTRAARVLGWSPDPRVDAKLFVRRLALDPGAEVLEIGPGSDGLWGMVLADAGAKVIAIDHRTPDVDLHAKFKRNFPTAPGSGNGRYRVIHQDYLRRNFGRSKISVIIARNVLDSPEGTFNFKDKDREPMIQKIAKEVSVGGWLILSSLYEHDTMRDLVRKTLAAEGIQYEEIPAKGFMPVPSRFFRLVDFLANQKYFILRITSKPAQLNGARLAQSELSKKIAQGVMKVVVQIGELRPKAILVGGASGITIELLKFGWTRAKELELVQGDLPHLIQFDSQANQKMYLDQETPMTAEARSEFIASQFKNKIPPESPTYYFKNGTFVYLDDYVERATKFALLEQYFKSTAQKHPDLSAISNTKFMAFTQFPHSGSRPFKFDNYLVGVADEASAGALNDLNKNKPSPVALDSLSDAINTYAPAARMAVGLSDEEIMEYAESVRRLFLQAQAGSDNLELSARAAAQMMERESVTLADRKLIIGIIMRDHADEQINATKTRLGQTLKRYLNHFRIHGSNMRELTALVDEKRFPSPQSGKGAAENPSNDPFFVARELTFTDPNGMHGPPSVNTHNLSKSLLRDHGIQVRIRAVDSDTIFDTREPIDLIGSAIGPGTKLRVLIIGAKDQPAADWAADLMTRFLKDNDALESMFPQAYMVEILSKRPARQGARMAQRDAKKTAAKAPSSIVGLSGPMDGARLTVELDPEFVAGIRPMAGVEIAVELGGEEPAIVSFGEGDAAGTITVFINGEKWKEIPTRERTRENKAVIKQSDLMLALDEAEAKIGTPADGTTARAVEAYLYLSSYLGGKNEAPLTEEAQHAVLADLLGSVMSRKGEYKAVHLIGGTPAQRAMADGIIAASKGRPVALGFFIKSRKMLYADAPQVHLAAGSYFLKRPQLRRIAKRRFVATAGPDFDRTANTMNLIAFNPVFSLIEMIGAIDELSFGDPGFGAAYEFFKRLTGHDLTAEEFMAFLKGDPAAVTKYSVPPILRGVDTALVLRSALLRSRMTQRSA